MVSNTTFRSPQLHLDWVLPATERRRVNTFDEIAVLQAAVVAMTPFRWPVPICGHHWKIPNRSLQLLIAVGPLLLVQPPDPSTLCY